MPSNEYCHTHNSKLWYNLEISDQIIIFYSRYLYERDTWNNVLLESSRLCFPIETCFDLNRLHNWSIINSVWAWLCIMMSTPNHWGDCIYLLPLLRQKNKINFYYIDFAIPHVISGQSLYGFQLRTTLERNQDTTNYRTKTSCISVWSIYDFILLELLVTKYMK